MVKSLDSMMYNISILNERNSKVNTALSTKEALEYGSDDSVTYSYILSLQGDINTYESIEDNINLSDPFSSTSDNALQQSKDVTDAIKALLIKANTSTTSNVEKKIISTQIEDYKSSLFSLANTNVNGQYVFSGVNTDIPPFTEDSSTGEISYQSDNSIKSLNVEKATYTPLGVNGIDAFFYDKETVGASGSLTFSPNEVILDENGDQWKLMDPDGDDVYDGLYLNGDTSSTPLAVIDNGDGTYTTTVPASSEFTSKESIFDSLNRVIASLKQEDLDGNSITEDEAKTILNQTQEEMNDAYESQNIANSIVGSRQSTIETYSDIVSSKLLNLKTLEEEYAGADLTALAIESKALENTYTALYSTINRMSDLSLVNYLN